MKDTHDTTIWSDRVKKMHYRYLGYALFAAAGLAIILVSIVLVAIFGQRYGW